MPIISPYSYSDTALSEQLFERLERLRLEQNITQTQLAEEIGITPKTYRNLATGNTKLIVLIAALRALNQLHHLDGFIPEEPISPLQMAKLKGQTRQRAYSKRSSGDSQQSSARKTQPQNSSSQSPPADQSNKMAENQQEDLDW